MSSPRAVFGVPMHNHARHLPEALESLLGQSERDLAVVLVDDASTDETDAIAERFAARDERVTCVRNARRLGLAGSWTRAFEEARRLHPGAEYFAWGSDHDAWHPRWLQVLLSELDQHPEAVVAYPRSVRMGDRGEFLHFKPPWRFDTAGVRDPEERFERFVRGGRAGDMIYGLFRADALGAVPFRALVGADRLVLAELAFKGEFRQVDEILWYRRYALRVTSRRQREASFPDGAPVWARTPWPFVHTALLARTLPTPNRARLSGRYLKVVWVQQVNKRIARSGSRIRRGVKLVRLAIFYAGAARQRLLPARR